MNKLARFVVVPLAFVAAVACDKGKSGGGAGGGGATGAAGASAIAPAKGGLDRALSAMPKDTEFVVGVDVAKLRKSALFKKYEGKLMEQIGGDLAKFKATCGFDPMEKLTGVLVGGSGANMANGTFFVRGFERAAAMDCLKKHEASEKAAGKAAALTVDGDYVEFTDGGGADNVMRMMWLDDQTALMIKQGEMTAGKDALAAAAGAKAGEGLTSSKAFTDLLAKTSTSAPLWFVMKGDSAMAGDSPIPFKAVYGSVDVSSGIAAAVRLWMSSADEAKSAAADLNKQAEMAKAFADISIKADGEDLALSVKMSQSQLEQITKMVGGGF